MDMAEQNSKKAHLFHDLSNRYIENTGAVEESNHKKRQLIHTVEEQDKRILALQNDLHSFEQRMVEQEHRFQAHVEEMRSGSQLNDSKYVGLKKNMDDRFTEIFTKLQVESANRHSAIEDVHNLMLPQEKKLVALMMSKVEEETVSRKQVDASMKAELTANFSQSLHAEMSKMNDIMAKRIAEFHPMLTELKEMLGVERQARERDVRDTRTEASKELEALRNTIGTNCKDIRKEIQDKNSQILSKIDAIQREMNKETTSLDAIILQMEKKAELHADELQKSADAVLRDSMQKLEMLIKNNADGLPRIEALIQEERQARRDAIAPIVKELREERMDREKDERSILEMVEANMTTIWKMQSDKW